ncbi:oligopeptide transporter [Rhypophila decipiens]|uniref:Oligopeptide transporter n=1 Tax=Rhypophila decipiens TaxID=261697 RepID=A0AAN6Y0W0_9PEZI|nr:oligopeptide transporter [Rhypophila decipiens]
MSSDTDGTRVEQLATVRDRVPLRVYIISTVILLERAAFFGCTTTFQNYLQNGHDDPLRPGLLGLGQSTAVAIIYAFSFLNYVTPLLGGIVADTWIGRYRAIQLGLLCDTLGIAILATTAFTQHFHHVGGLAGYIVAICLIAFGAGGAKPNLMAFMIDQCPEQDAREIYLKDGKRVLTDRGLTVQFIYNMNYWMINLGSLAGILTTLTEKVKGFGYAYLIPLGFMVVALAVFHLETSRYVLPMPTQNILPVVFRLIIRRSRGRSGPAAEQSNSSVLESDRASPTPTLTNDDAILAKQVKTAIKSCLIFTPFIPLYFSIDLMSNNLISQAGTMSTHGLPNDIMFNVNAISVMILLPLIQGLLYPVLAKHSIPFPPTYRVVTGLFFAALAIAYTTGVQALIYENSPCGRFALSCGARESGLSIWLQTPTYVLLALAEILAIVSGTELAYTRAPEGMKSIVQAVFILFGAGGAILGVASSPAARDPYMVVVYAVISGVMGVTTAVFCLENGREEGVELGVVEAVGVGSVGRGGNGRPAEILSGTAEGRAELGTVNGKNGGVDVVELKTNE